MKITVCGSIAFYDEMIAVQKELEMLGHEVKIPNAKFTDGSGNDMAIKDAYIKRQSASRSDLWVWDEKERAIQNHFDKVAWCDAILVLNYDKNNIPFYVGANTLMEMGVALYLHKPIYMLNDVPKISYEEEILGMKPIILNGNLKSIPK